MSICDFDQGQQCSKTVGPFRKKDMHIPLYFKFDYHQTGQVEHLPKMLVGSFTDDY